MNLIWFLVDSVRNYHTKADDRGRLELMDKIAGESVEFSTVVTSAPSTVMALSSMMTGWPSVFMSRTYYGFKHDRIRFPSVGNILEDNGYNNYHILFFPEGRDLLNELMYPLEKCFWPGGIKSAEIWNNDQVNLILQNILGELKEPFFLYVHYNCRRDPETSSKVEKGIDLFKEKGLFNNSIFILNSDHGYPDPQRQLKFYEMREKGHDLILTDDNILVPLFLKFPGCPNKTIRTPVSSLNITPTILEILGYEHPNYINSKYKADSLLPLIRDEEKNISNTMVRIDNRFIFQPDRKAAIRSHKYKYIYSWGNNGEFTEEFYDIEKDKLEQNNLIEISDKLLINEINKFRMEFQAYETEVFFHHREYINNKLKNIVRAHSGIETILFCAECNDNFSEIVINSISTNFPEIVLTILTKTSDKKKRLLKKINVDCSWVNFDDNLIVNKKIYDLAFLPLITHNDYFNRSLVKSIKTLNIRNLYFTNYNLEPEKKPGNWIIAGLIWLNKGKSRLKTNPKTFLYDVFLNIKKVISN